MYLEDHYGNPEPGNIAWVDGVFFAEGQYYMQEGIEHPKSQIMEKVPWFIFFTKSINS